MKISRMFRAVIPSIALLASASIASDAAAQDAKALEGAVKARQGYMQLLEFTVGPLFGMAKGAAPYDAEKASAIAANLQALTKYDGSGAWIGGTSKADMPGKTRAEAGIWQDMEKFGGGYKDMVTAIDALATQAGGGQDALAASVSEVGKACGACHKAFRAKEF